MLPFQTTIKPSRKGEPPALIITDTTVGDGHLVASTSIVLTRGDLHQISLALTARRSVEVSPAPGLNRADIRTWEDDMPAFWVIDREHGTQSVHKNMQALARDFRKQAIRLAEIEAGYDFVLVDGGDVELQLESNGHVSLVCTPSYCGEPADVELTSIEAKELADALYALAQHDDRPFA